MAVKILNMSVLIFVLASFVLQSTYAASYTVGDTTGWNARTNGNTDLYNNWAANKNFLVGDILVFNFATGSHTVAEVTEADYNNCNSNNPTSIQTTGPASIVLNKTGAYHFICTVPGHCTVGQKLSIEVRTGPVDTAPTPGSSPNAPGTPGSDPSSSPSSTSSLVAVISLAIMSIILVLVC
ncbi:hypothetical protein V6N13_118708 [Hibiscus sabdariffa]|uniref:Phytocyanin domain-containing protein n=1 Tax=Hibiscus sabdariffa TaxID=183260 RepID=A0ABR2DZ34_9ROSI